MRITHNNKPLVQLNKISKAFPGVQALNEVDFEVNSGEVVAIVGENGAGKSTLIKILGGIYEPDSGEIIVDGVKIEHENVRKAKEQGISIIHQEFNLTPNQSVAENIFLGKEPVNKGILGKLKVVDKKHIYRESEKLLNQVGARFAPETLISKLSVANQQIVEIAKSLSTKSKVIIMDEPTSTLGKGEVKTLFEIICSLKSQGIGIVFITHRLEEVFEIADRVVVLRDGRFVKQMMISEASKENLINLMVGRKLDRMAIKHKTYAIDDYVLEVKDLCRGKALQNISFQVRRGEVLGISGLVGAGRTEIARAIFGADKYDSGEIFVEGQKVEIASPNDAVVKGIALVPENRQLQGLIQIQSVARNIALPSLKALSNNRVVHHKKMAEIVKKYINLLSVKTPNIDQKVCNLSGGNQQKVVFAKWLASNPKILILDEPTRGIDVGAKAEIYAMITDLASQGIGIIMISSEMPEILLMSDRIMVMYEGKTTGILTREEATQDKIMAYASGQV